MGAIRSGNRSEVRPVTERSATGTRAPATEQHERRVAPVVAGAWFVGEGPTPALHHLSLPERAKLAAHFCQLGQREHAAIASFARFSLQLLSLGAPPELLDACTRALADTTAHTKLCFQVASAYAGCVLGPGPLDVSGSLEQVSLLDVVDLVLAEGCFGKTSAALEALEARDAATDAVIREVYARMAEDQQRQAELAFRFVRWALERDREAVKRRVAHVLAGPAPDTASAAVARPCLRAMLASPAEG